MPRRPVSIVALATASLLSAANLAAPQAQPAFWGGEKRPYTAPAPASPPRHVPAPAEAAAPDQPLSAEELQPTADDPPILVGRVAQGTGTATMRLPGSDEWQPATLNTTITEGTALWTEPRGMLAIDVAQSGLFLEGGTALQIDALEEAALRATLAQGSVFLRLDGMEAGDGMVEIATAEARFATAVDGRYLIEAAPSDGSGPGRITVFEGAAEITVAGTPEPLRLGPGEAVALRPGEAPERVAAGGATPLMAWALGSALRRPLPQAVHGMTGAADLGRYGQWDRSGEYGDVWYPPVATDWTPYRDGSWQWREPWGWVWVDAAPWGFAPSHYGRWVQIGPRWAWAPQPVRVVGSYVRPAWAPALVVFFGSGRHGPAGRPVGWLPLGPREAYYPWYRASPRYVQRVNVRQVVNVHQVRNVWNERGDRELDWSEARRRDASRSGGFHDRRLDEFRNRRAAVEVPERVMQASLPVRPEARRLRPEEMRRGEALGGLPLRPDASTRGVTERSAERLGLPPESFRRGPDTPRAATPPPAAQAALTDGRRGDRRPDQPRPPEAARRPDGPRFEGGQNDSPRPPVARDAEQREPQRQLRERLTDERSRRGPAPDAAGPRTQGDAMPRQQQDPQPGRLDNQERRQQQEDQARRQKPEQPRLQPNEMQRQQQDRARGQQDEQMRRQPQDQARRQQDEQARRQQQDQTRRQQDDQMQRQQQDQARRQQDDQMRRQQQDQARRQQDEQMRRQQQDQARRQQDEQMRRQQQQQQEQTRRRQDEQMQRQQQDQARRQQDEQMRRQQQQQQEQARRQQQDQARRQQDDSRRQQQQQQQQEQSRRQQDESRRQQQEQRRQEQARRDR